MMFRRILENAAFEVGLETLDGFAPGSRPMLRMPPFMIFEGKNIFFKRRTARFRNQNDFSQGEECAETDRRLTRSGSVLTFHRLLHDFKQETTVLWPTVFKLSAHVDFMWWFLFISCLQFTTTSLCRILQQTVHTIRFFIELLNEDSCKKLG